MQNRKQHALYCGPDGKRTYFVDFPLVFFWHSTDHVSDLAKSPNSAEGFWIATPWTPLVHNANEQTCTWRGTARKDPPKRFIKVYLSKPGSYEQNHRPCHKHHQASHPHGRRDATSALAALSVHKCFSSNPYLYNLDFFRIRWLVLRNFTQTYASKATVKSRG